MTIAYHNDAALQSTVIEQMRAHERADEIIQGKYWEGGKGCFIGCIAHGSDVGRVEDLTGLPQMLTRIAEAIFEGLPNDKAKAFPLRVLMAPALGADLSLVSWKFLHWVVGEALARGADDATRQACAPAVSVLERMARGEPVSTGEAADAARAAARAADAVAWEADAARAAAEAAAAGAAAAAWSAEAAEAAAAWSAEAAWAATVPFEEQAEKLIELLAQA